MVAGYDPTGPGLYYVDSDGQRTKGSIFSVGSGSLYAYGVLDNSYNWCGSALRILLCAAGTIQHCSAYGGVSPLTSACTMWSEHVLQLFAGIWR